MLPLRNEIELENDMRKRLLRPTGQQRAETTALWRVGCARLNEQWEVRENVTEMA